VHSDPVLLETIMPQLVANAGKHGGGSAHLSAEEKDDAVEIEVRDSGPGISPEDQERIFAEFVHLNGSDGGLGVGLTIANKLAALMNHKIEVRSAPGQGATFIVRAKRA
jgi:signal transduction histidine kinase